MSDKKWEPIVIVATFYCSECIKQVAATLTVYHDATYVTCHPRHHHYTYGSPQEVPGLDTYIEPPRLGEE